MKLFSFNKRNSEKVNLVQTCEAKTATHPFSAFEEYVPLSHAKMSLYSSLREAVPVIDAAISKLVRLVGTFEIQCKDKAAQKAVDRFLKNIKVNGTSYGAEQFIYTYFDQLLTYGTAVGEIVMNKDKTRVCALYNASLENIELSAKRSPLDVDVMVRSSAGELRKVKDQSLILLSLLNPTPGKAVGNSILSGLPFVSSILLKILNSIGQNFDRVGNVRFAVTYKPESNSSSVSSKQKADQIAKEWSRAMRDKTRVCDFVSVGDVSIKAIGADNQILDADVPMRHILEQIVSKLSIPPFLLGFSWSSTERMSSQQADILTSELEYYRTILNPVIRRIADAFFESCGLYEDFDIVWNNISLQDETELASARLQNAQAALLEKELEQPKDNQKPKKRADKGNKAKSNYAALPKTETKLSGVKN